MQHTRLLRHSRCIDFYDRNQLDNCSPFIKIELVLAEFQSEFCHLRITSRCRIVRSPCRAVKLHSISPAQTFRFCSFPQHRNKSIWYLPPSLWADRAFERRRTHSYSGNPYSTRCFLRQTRSFLLSVPPSISCLSRCRKVETCAKSIGQVRPEKKAFNGYISLPRTSRFNDDTESAEFPNHPFHCPTLSNSFTRQNHTERRKVQKIVSS